MQPINYGPFARLSDWYQGWRDGVVGIPDPDRRIATTGHREILIRRAQDAFDHERLALEVRRADALERLAGIRVRREQAVEALGRARADLAALNDEPTAAELRRRRPGEQERTAIMVRLRRQREHAREIAARRLRVDAAERQLRAIDVDLAAVVDAIDREVNVAGVRVRRIHEHAHRRLAAYRRKLVRCHPAGDWVNTAMDTLAPDLPGWAVRGFGEDELEPDPIGYPSADDDSSWPSAKPDVIALGSITSIGAGRSSSNEATVHIEISGYGVAGHHATLRRHGDGYRLQDHGRGNGTYQDGRPVRRVDLRVGDRFQIDDYEFRLLAGDRLERQWLGQCALVVHCLNATKPKSHEPWLTKMSFIQRPRTLLAVLGPSGAGKSTLFSAVLGELPGAQGERYFQDHDLRTHPALIRNSLGYVPQGEDTFYQSLTVERLLTYSDRLRRPRDRRAGRRVRVIKVCKELGIEMHLHRPVRLLSGGERRRVSIALEILAEPRLLMLDEPTSGLDAAKDLEVMTLLRRYAAEEGRSVITITHSTEHLDLAHQVLVVVSEGRPVHLGPPGAVLTDLQVANYTTLMDRLTRDPGPVAEAYQGGSAAKTAKRKADELRAASSSAERPPPIRARRTAGSVWRQLPVLVQRQLLLTINRAPAGTKRWLAWAMPLLVAIAGAMLAGFVVSDTSWGDPAPSAAQSSARTALSLLVTLTMLGGQALTYSDVVTERLVVHREHRTGVLPSAVVLSKWIIFAAIAVLQAILVTATFAMVAAGPSRSLALAPTVELAVNLIATSITAMSAGLLISVVAKRLEQAVALATGTAIAQVALSGGLSTLDGDLPLQALAWLLPARWGFAASAASVDLATIAPGTPPDALWHHDTGQWIFNLAFLGGLTILYTALAIVRLAKSLTIDNGPYRMRQRYRAIFSRNG